VGLFVEHSGVFVALQSILQSTHAGIHRDIYCLHLEPRPAPPKPVPWTDRPEVWIAILLPVAAYLWYSEAHLYVAPALYDHVGPAIFQTGWTLFDTVIQMPLAELYRQGR
jgi:hypothetical protein